ncbi:MAG: molybdopterin-dependent oxidoreductase, partial [Aquificae bacterium]|nr:molybdopterin-dependent oxidoreductase [Aquificota bacterium]
MSLSRRDFLKLLSTAVLFGGVKPVSGREKPSDLKPFRNLTEDMYRKEYALLRPSPAEKGAGFHCVSCKENCLLEVWTKDGKIQREKQKTDYPPPDRPVPDLNPQGCVAGIQHSQVLRQKDRILYPMKRAGKRGEGKWERVSWEEAITEIAENIYSTLLEKGSEGLFVQAGTGLSGVVGGGSVKRFGALLGAVSHTNSSAVGSFPNGVAVVFGSGYLGFPSDFIYTADLNLWWGIDPNKTRTPEAHFIWEGRYNGSKQVVISPDFNSTASKSDLWIPVRAGYDGFLAMALINSILEN